jgi:hypothetical protein
MSTWFECKVKYQKIDEQGKQKRVTEPYLVDAVSFADAEARTNKVLEPYISGEFLVTGAKIANFSDIIPNPSGGTWHKCKVAFISYDEERGTERKSNSYMLVEAENIPEACKSIDESMKGCVSDYSIEGVNVSPIMDVFTYNIDCDKEEQEEQDDS